MISNAIRLFFCTMVLAGLSFPGPAAQAQEARPNYRPSLSAPPPELSANAKLYAGMVADNCLENWESPFCLRVLSESNRVLVSGYMETLEREGMGSMVEQIKQSCAASTAGEKQDYPAYAMKSAFTECANAISDSVDATRVSPDLDHYQLLTGAVLCLSKDKRCRNVVYGLHKMKR